SMERFNDVEPVLRSGLGHELALDARGAVRVPRPARELSVVAARGELHGTASLRPRDAECVVELKPYHELTVEVVDRSNRPVVGATVVVYWGDFNPYEHLSPRTTDDDGRVLTPKLEEQLWPEGYRGPMRVALGAGLSSEPELVSFDTANVPADPVR